MQQRQAAHHRQRAGYPAIGGELQPGMALGAALHGEVVRVHILQGLFQAEHRAGQQQVVRHLRLHAELVLPRLQRRHVLAGIVGVVAGGAGLLIAFGVADVGRQARQRLERQRKGGRVHAGALLGVLARGGHAVVLVADMAQAHQQVPLGRQRHYVADEDAGLVVLRDILFREGQVRWLRRVDRLVDIAHRGAKYGEAGFHRAEIARGDARHHLVPDRPGVEVAGDVGIGGENAEVLVRVQVDIAGEDVAAAADVVDIGKCRDPGVVRLGHAAGELPVVVEAVVEVRADVVGLGLVLQPGLAQQHARVDRRRQRAIQVRAHRGLGGDPAFLVVEVQLQQGLRRDAPVEGAGNELAGYVAVVAEVADLLACYIEPVAKAAVA